MKRIISLALTLSLLLTALLAVVPASAEETPAGELKVSAASLEFSSKVYLMIAVDYSELYSDYDSAKAEVTVTVTNKQGVETELLPDDSVRATEGFPENSVGFKLTTLGAKNMADQLKIQAYNGDNASGDPVTYSILEYAVAAKESTDDPALEYAIDCMLELGAEAQRAFNYAGDYPLYDEEGYIDYGMLVVYGGAQKKVFGKIGSELTPAASADIGANAVLYDTAYDEIANNTVKVEGGVKKCFFVGDATRTLINLDMDKYVGDSKTVHTYYNGSTVVNKTLTLYMKADGTVTATKPSGTDGVDYASFATNASPTATNLDGGFKIAEKGAFTIVVGAVGPNVTMSSAAVLSAIAGDGKYTLSVTIKAPNGLVSMGDKDGNGGGTAIGNFNTSLRFRNDYLYLHPWQISNSKFYLGKAANNRVLGALSKTEFTTFHIVVDPIAGTFTGYDASGNCIGSCPADEYTAKTSAGSTSHKDAFEDFGADFGVDDYLLHSGTYLNWSMITKNTGIVLNRLTVTKGNIFE